MIVVTGSVLTRPDTVARATALCVAHSARSRAKDGCLHHAVHVDAENPLRLVFLERWRDRAAVAAHFADPAARAFVREVRALAAETTPMSVLEATELPLETFRLGSGT